MKRTASLVALITWTAGSALAADSTPILEQITHSAGQVELTWTNGFAPFQVQASTALTTNVWANLGDPAAGRTATLTPPSTPEAFFRVLGSPTASPTATYRLTFTSIWSASTHPTNFPSPSEHYSPLIGGTHNSNVVFWAPGTIASQGIESMAETGATGSLSSEVNTAISAGTADAVLSGGALGFSPGSIQMTFNISQSHPQVTLVTMIAPSPDWFLGVHGQNLLIDGDWVDTLTLNLLPYDAGTDSGISYGSANADTNPPDPISVITGFPLVYNGEVAPFGTFTFTRIDIP